jgi:hypothetical protein
MLGQRRRYGVSFQVGITTISCWLSIASASAQEAYDRTTRGFSDGLSGEAARSGLKQWAASTDSRARALYPGLLGGVLGPHRGSP